MTEFTVILGRSPPLGESYHECSVIADRFEIEGGSLVFYKQNDEKTIKKPEKIQAFNDWIEVERL